jgi:hypothetical protein
MWVWRSASSVVGLVIPRLEFGGYGYPGTGTKRNANADSRLYRSGNYHE